MAFPDSQVDAEVDLYLGDTLGWVNVLGAGDVRDSAADSGGGITITRGRPNEGREPDLTQCSLVLNNAGGRYSPRNPLSPYYGLLGRNTPVRVRVADTDPGGALAVDGRRDAAVSPGAAVTAAHSSLNGTGDLDVRVWLRMPRWKNHDGIFVAAKRESWSIAIGNPGSLEFRWWEASGTLRSTSSGVNYPAPLPDGSLAIRVVLTVATGVRQFYTAPTLAGPWTLLSQGTFGATSVRTSTYGVELGRDLQFNDNAVNGELYGAEIRSAGTLVASPDFTQLQAGDTSLTDAQGRVWTWVGGATPIDRGARFHGEVSSWPPRWNAAGTDQWVPVDAAGITRRMSQGNSPILSPLRRTLAAIDPAGYVPLEDGDQATQPATATAQPTSAVSRDVTFGEQAGRLGGTVSVAKLDSAASLITASVTPRPASTSTWSLLMFFKLPQMPVGGDLTYLRVHFSGGAVARWDFQLSGGGYRWIGYDRDGTAVADQNFNNSTEPPTDWLMMYMEWSRSGNTVTWQPWVANAGETTFTTSVWTYSGTLGYPTKMEVVGNTHFQDALVSHLAINDQRIFLTADFAKVSTAYAGETAGERMMRLALEEGVPFTFWGWPHDTTRLGPQPIVPLLDVWRDAAAADGGILTEARSHMGMHYRTRVSLYNQPEIELDYTHLAPPFDPTDDDDATRNDVTVSRPNGASARAVQESGPLSTANPPVGVGTYTTSETLNVAGDEQLADLASWLLHLGTVDEARYPRIRLNLAGTLASDQDLTRRVVLADAGDAASIGGLPTWLPPGPARVLVQGYTETIDGYEWSITWNAAPSSPWDVAVADGPQRIPAVGSKLATAISSTATSMQITSTTANGPWTTTAAYFPLDVRIGGERVTVSAITGTTSPQTATITARGVNGLQRAWPPGTEVNVWLPAVAAL